MADAGQTSSTGADDPRVAMSTHLAEVLGAKSIDNLTRLSGGASRETWGFSADGEQRILQRTRVGDVRVMSTEAAVLRAAHAADVPVARLLASGNDPEGRSFMVAEHVHGESIARKILRDEPYGEARKNLVAQCGVALARLHSVDAAHVPMLDSADQLAQWRQSLDSLNEQLNQSHPAFELAFRWLAANRPASARRCIVHGDFRLGNLMVDANGLAAVLDWELAHIGDPVEDLGWLCVRAWRFGSSKPVAGVGGYEDLLNSYNSAAGTNVTRDELRWWEVMGTLKWGIMCMLQASAHLLGVSRSHELAAIGRRVCENEYDLFLALDGAWGNLGARSGGER